MNHSNDTAGWLIIIGAIVTVTWIVFPFLVLARMGRMIAILESIRDQSKGAGKSEKPATQPPPPPPKRGG